MAGSGPHLRDVLDARNRQIAAVHMVSRLLSSSVDLEDRLRNVLTVSLAAVGAVAGTIYLHRPEDDALVFPTRDGRVWPEEHWRNWRQRIFAPAAIAAGLEQFRPYDLRHSFVSLLFTEGRTVIEVARQAGHSPTMALATYGHVIEELEDTAREPAEDVIRKARARHVPSEFPRRLSAAAAATGERRKVAANRGKPSDGLEPSTPSLRWAPIGNWSQPAATVLACFRLLGV
jgi:hypothetical protein